MTVFPARSTAPEIVWRACLLAYLDPMHPVVVLSFVGVTL